MLTANRYICLRMVEGTGVAIYKHDGPRGPGDGIPARYDLFPHPGGFAWGYAGSGPQSLAWALAARFFPELPKDELALRKDSLLQFISSLSEDDSHDVPVDTLLAHVASRHR
ncbi:hypothetical protein GCM10028794_28500 [Silanimonas algicola]